ncbi:unnamed protein product, partial [Polarella glacialis]
AGRRQRQNQDRARELSGKPSEQLEDCLTDEDTFDPFAFHPETGMPPAPAPGSFPGKPGSRRSRRPGTAPSRQVSKRLLSFGEDRPSTAPDTSRPRSRSRPRNCKEEPIGTPYDAGTWAEGSRPGTPSPEDNATFRDYSIGPRPWSRDSGERPCTRDSGERPLSRDSGERLQGSPGGRERTAWESFPPPPIK